MEVGDIKKLEWVYSQFTASGGFYSAKAFGTGYINDTYLIKTRETNTPDYVLQSINSDVFKDVPAMLQNISDVTNYMQQQRERLVSYAGFHYILQLIPSKNNENFVIDSGNNYWCMYYYIPESKTVDIIEDSDMAYESGKAYGNFFKLVSDFPARKLHITIPNFHNMKVRLNQLLSAINNDPISRVKEVRKLLSFVEERASEMCKIQEAGEANIIPLRVTHNDTKGDNLLFDKNNNALCVIDLGTVMPGYVHFDFGDAIRSVANKNREDEPDIGAIHFDLDLFKAFTSGYLENTYNFLTKHELAYLPLSVKMMTFIMGVRFLTDYINGDIYYRIFYPENNLNRANAQFKLIELMEKDFDKIESFIKQF